MDATETRSILRAHVHRMAKAPWIAEQGHALVDLIERCVHEDGLPPWHNDLVLMLESVNPPAGLSHSSC